MRRIIAMIRKEFHQIISDKFMLRFLIAAPLFQLILLGYALTMETEHVKTIICDLDKSSISRQFVESISNNDRFDIIGTAGSYDEMETDIRNWTTVIGLYIPLNFPEILGKQAEEIFWRCWIP